LGYFFGKFFNSSGQPDLELDFLQLSFLLPVFSFADACKAFALKLKNENQATRLIVKKMPKMYPNPFFVKTIQ
jgi:hypothetical protein